ncbi:MT-A70-domain-containing protein [Filobasidium floriforme]|uniref:MT-A70-domain-containing protein n=1 Tax=Filobasidium floriforme TaxID=5210 RepID=UPI001E8D65A9|nr:MT-A70-domain-containing protein [Filobasidium floriforme]KAH8082767.1 MT-A70-domain-containing protein [Filobasidium floriforme]
MSSILKRPASPIPSASGPNHTAKKVKLEEAIQDTEELYDPDLDDGLARVGQVSPTSSPGSDLKEAKAEVETDGEVQQEILALLKRPTGLDKLIALASLPDPLPAFEPVCPQTTTTACPESSITCPYPHYEPIIRPWTEPRLGQCSYLNMCYGDPLFHSNPSLINSGGQGPGPGTSGAGGKQCRYQHYRLIPPPSLVANHEHIEDRSRRRENERERRVPKISKALREKLLGPRLFSTTIANAASGAGYDDQDGTKERKGVCSESQWLNMDVRQLDEKVLGKFELILADPPWDIHMNLPYLLLTDDDLRRLPIPSLQPTWGLLALWVTGRAMELARELFALWGYRRVDEVVWVKTGQLGGLVRTGRTGHWLNHTCEHLLLAVKLPPVSEFPDRNAPISWGDPALAHLKRGIDGDVVVSEVRETSRKPDEVYGLLERMVPSGRKLEIFGRKHNTRPKWLTIGNQRKQTRGILTAVPVTAAEENALTCLQLAIAKWLTPNSSERWKKPRSC